jgi:tetratricopeptide (TPR) repeat protein
MGLAAYIGGTKHLLGLVLARRAKYVEAVEVEQAALDAFEELGDGRMAAGCHFYLALIHLLAGRYDDAAAQSHTARDQAGEAFAQVAMMATATLARALLATGVPKEALVLSRQCMAFLQGGGSLEEGEATARLVHAEALWAVGEQGEAARVIDEARTLLMQRAELIRDETVRRSFLYNVPDSARTLALARRWLGE